MHKRKWEFVVYVKLGQYFTNIMHILYIVAMIEFKRNKFIENGEFKY